MEERLLWKSPESSMSPPSPIGRVMSTILGAHSRHLEAAISRLGPAPSRSSSGAVLEESLCFLWRHVEDTFKSGERLDQILIPMIEHSLKFKGSKHSKQVLILIEWLFQDELLFRAISSNLAEIITRKEDHYIALGWCTLVSGLVELSMNQISDTGKQEKHITLLKILCRSFSHLLSILRKGSTLQDGFELPTRLSVAAADCTLVLSEALTKKAPLSEAASCKGKSTHTNYKQLVMLVPASNNEKECDTTHKFAQGLEDMELERLLWDHLDELIFLVQKLQAWSRKSRPLHANGLEQVLKWLLDVKQYYGSVQDEADGNFLRSGMLLISSCWKHYAMLLRLEDFRFFQHHAEMLDQYLSAIQVYSNNDMDDHPVKLNSSIETRKFFLNCIALLLGRLHAKQLEIAIPESGPLLLNLLFAQLVFDDEDLIQGAVSILRAIIFTANLPSASSLLDTQQIEAVLPSLLKLLDERDSTARAAVLLTAEYCYKNPDGQGLQEIFKRLEFGNPCQKMNAVDVISELIHVSSDSENILSPSLRQDIAKHLLEHLGDEELRSHIEASNLFPQLEPSFVLPALVRLVYHGNENVSLSASNAIVSVLRCHHRDFGVLATLLDCLSNLSQTINFPKSPEGIGKGASGSSMPLQTGSKLDVDRVLKLIPKWSESVQNWSVVIDQLIDRMFLNPSDAILVRFMSYISEHLAEAGDLVLHRVLLFMQEQNDMDENWFYGRTCGAFPSKDVVELKGSVFNRLCPLLIIRLLPLSVLNDLDSSSLYGHLGNQEILSANKDVFIDSRDCVAALLFNRAFSLIEFEDVRKLAAELCGRLHPQVLLPIIGFQLEHAAQYRDVLKMKACLFAVCTSLVARGKDSYMHPVMPQIQKILETILLWPSSDADEVSKAQHGCIDCLALMICAEVQDSESSKHFSRNKLSIVTEAKNCRGDGATTSSILTYVIQRLTCDENSFVLSDPDASACYRSGLSDDKSWDTSFSESEIFSNAPTPLPFRLCMANVLISACQKVSESGKHLFACRILPGLISAVEEIIDSEVRAACLQVLFSTVYHLKSLVLPFSSDLFKLSIKALKKGSVKEQIAAAKVMATLMASEDAIVESISAGLLEAKLVLAGISLTDSPPELRKLCQKLLLCVTSPIR